MSAVAVLIYAKGYIKPYLGRKSPAQISLHYCGLGVLYLSMLLVVTLRDGFSFLFAWEVMTLSSFVLMLFDAERREVRRAALSYLILMHVGFLFLLAGFVTLYASGLPASFDALALYGEQGGNIIPLFIVFLIGFGMKAGIFPLHVWLPEAHPAAPAHISAFMSGVMIKTGVYGVMRVVSCFDSHLFAIGLIVLCIGAVTGLWGVILAALQNDVKKLLAYSSIENIGIIFIALGTALLGKAEGSDPIFYAGMAGALLHTLNHSFFKSLLFMGAGNIYTATHTTSLDDLGGLGKRMPVTAILFLVGTLAICALPPLSGFVSEFLIYMGLLDGIAANGPVTVIALSGLIFLALIGGWPCWPSRNFTGSSSRDFRAAKWPSGHRRFPVRCSRRWHCRWRVSCWWGWRLCSRCGGSSGSWPGLPMFREPLRSLFRRTYWTARCLFQTASCRLLTGSGCWWEFPSYCGCCARGSCAVVQKALRLHGIAALRR
ncbi:MAG: proton-conducting transporter membrane subunit [Alistipes indistinctus]